MALAQMSATKRGGPEQHQSWSLREHSALTQADNNQDGAPIIGQQQQRQHPSHSSSRGRHQPLAFPWSAHRLNLIPPRIISKTGINVPTSPSTSPFPRYGHALSATGSLAGYLYLFGGLVHDSAQNDTYILNIRNNTASLFQTTGRIPCPRFGHVCALVGDVFVVWGGDTNSDPNLEPSDEHDNHLYLLNLISRDWNQIKVLGPAPVGRYGHAATTVGTKLFIFGGQNGGLFLNDLWAFDLNYPIETRPVWEQLEPASLERPAPRTGHSCVAYADTIIVFGGTDGKYYYGDTWSFNLQTRKWTELNCLGLIPSAREGHAAAIVGDIVYIFGGRDINGKDLSDMAAFKLSNHRWYIFQHMGPSLDGRSGHAMASNGTRVYILGGESFPPSESDDPNIMYSLETSCVDLSIL